MTGFDSKRRIALDRLDDDDIQIYAQPEQEPVAWAIYDKRGGSKSLHWPEQHSPDGDANMFDAVPLYTTPPKREWVGLTDEDMKDPKTHNFDFIYGARWAEAKLNDKFDRLRWIETAKVSNAAQQEEKEPYGYMSECGIFQKEKPEIGRWETLYTTPPQRPWVGLTDEDCKGMSAGDKVVAMWANRTVKEKNT